MGKLNPNKDSLNRMDFDSFLFGIYAMIPAIVLIPPAYVPSLTGRILTPIYFSVIFVVLLRILLKQYFLKMGKSFSVLLIMLILVFYFCVTYIFENTTLTFVNFVAYVIMPLLISSLLPISVKNVLRVIIVLPTPGIFVINRIFELGGYYEEALTLGTCYAFLVPVLASIIYLCIFIKDDSILLKIFLILCIAINIAYSFQLVIHGSRGPLLSLLLLPMILFTITTDGVGLKIKTVRFIVTFVSILLVILFFLPAIVGIDSYFESVGFEIQALNKIIMLNDQMDISNGRTELAARTIAEIPNRLLFGHGLSTSESVIHIQYPHNCILQLLFDGGLFLFLIITIPILRKLFMFSHYCNRYQYAIILLFFLSAFPGALLSSDMWENPRLWFFVGVTLSLSFTKNKRKDVKAYC